MADRYSYRTDGKTFLSPHFQVREFRCKDGSDTVYINPALITVLEQLFERLGAKAINITSGYRTPQHSVNVGGYATDQHTKGNAADIKAKKPDGSLFSSKEITLALEDMGHTGGIGLINKNGAVHIDVRGRKAWFDETDNERTVHSWYEYWGESKPEPTEPVLGTYYPKEDLNIRAGAGVDYGVVETNGAKRGQPYAVVEIARAGSQDWGRIGVGKWICLAYCAQEPPQDDGLTAYVLTCDMLKVRKRPSTASKRVGQYYRGETFYVRKWQGNWAQLKSGNWMCAGKYCKKA